MKKTTKAIVIIIATLFGVAIVGATIAGITIPFVAANHAKKASPPGDHSGASTNKTNQQPPKKPAA